MKAKDLIKILELNPESDVKLYNGMVDDWMDIQVDNITLVKERPSRVLEQINFQRNKDGLPLWDKLKKNYYKERDWEFENEYNVHKKGFTRKNVLLVQGKLRNKSSFDRLGKINY